MTRDRRKVDLRGPALSPRCAAGRTLHLLTFLNEARGPKKTVGDGVARRRQVHQEHLLLDVATSDAAPLSTREPDARRRLTRRGEARITHPRGVTRGRVPARQAEGGLETAAHNLAVRVAKRRCDAASRAHLFNLLPLSRTAFPPRRAASTAALVVFKDGS